MRSVSITSDRGLKTELCTTAGVCTLARDASVRHLATIYAMSRPSCGAFSLLVLFSWTTVAAQTRATTADLAGVVYDQSRSVLPGATVTATNAETNHVRSAATDGTGRFAIPALPPGCIG